MKFFTNVLLLLVLLFSVIFALPNSTDDSLSINDTSPTDDSLSIISTNVNVTTRADQTPMWCSVDVYLHENITLKKSESRHDRRMYITTKSYKGGALIDGLKYMDTNKELFRWQKFWGNFNVRITNILGPKIVSSLDMKWVHPTAENPDSEWVDFTYVHKTAGKSWNDLDAHKPDGTECERTKRRNSTWDEWEERESWCKWQCG